MAGTMTVSEARAALPQILKSVLVANLRGRSRG
jgi:hypothetical protein